MRVLVAEDDPIMRHLVSKLVESWGYEVVTVENGAEAMFHLQMDDSPQLAILDWKMPVLSGIDVVRKLRAEKREAYTYVLLLTSESEKDRLLDALRSGCDDYITKPFDTKELQARLFVGSRIMQLQGQLALALQAAQFQGTHDALTGTFNRGAVIQHLEKELARASRNNDPVALMLLDVDRFKQINDSHGHLTGDAVLRLLANRLTSAVRQYDAVGRYGGEEFVAILPNCNIDEALRIAERIRAEVSATPMIVEGRELPVTVSIGVAVANAGSNVNLLLREADGALYRAKDAGRNRVCAATPLEPWAPPLAGYSAGGTEVSNVGGL